MAVGGLITHGIGAGGEIGEIVTLGLSGGSEKGAGPFSRQGLHGVMTTPLNSFAGKIGVTCALTGTVTATIDEGDIVTGSKTIILTLTGTTWVPG